MAAAGLLFAAFVIGGFCGYMIGMDVWSRR
jgi:hypothetical protein